VVVTPCSRTKALAQEDSNVSFRWAFGALVGPENPPRLVPITQDTTLKTGDRLKMLVELQKACFVYVIHHGPHGEVHWLFPYNQQQIDTDYQTGKRYEIPHGEGWFKLDDQVGQETFYLLASSERLPELETLLHTYATAAPTEQPQLATTILTEIREVKKRYRQFATLAERPVPIAGNMRGPDITDLAVEITANNFYSKTFTIEHR
jgi:hypothetical protein